MANVAPVQDDASSRTKEAFLEHHSTRISTPMRGTTCAICQEDFPTDENATSNSLIRFSNCRHEFHWDCWNTWVASPCTNVNRCPTCRDVLFQGSDDVPNLLTAGPTIGLIEMNYDDGLDFDIDLDVESINREIMDLWRQELDTVISRDFERDSTNESTGSNQRNLSDLSRVSDQIAPDIERDNQGMIYQYRVLRSNDGNSSDNGVGSHEDDGSDTGDQGNDSGSAPTPTSSNETANRPQLVINITVDFSFVVSQNSSN